MSRDLRRTPLGLVLGFDVDGDDSDPFTEGLGLLTLQGLSSIPIGGGRALSGIATSRLCPGDVDRSGNVDFIDLLAVLAEWGPCPGCCATDLNNDGAVTFGDLLALLATWGDCPAWAP